MVFRAVNCLLGLLVLIALHHNASAALTESEMKAKLAAYNKEALKQCNRSVKAGWNVATDVGNAEKEKERERVSVEYAKFKQEEWQATWRDANVDDYRDESVRRQLTFLKELGSSALSEADLIELSRVVSSMSTIYNTATVCPFENQNCNKQTDKVYTLDPELDNRFAHSRNFDELKYLWKEWRDNSGQKMRQSYKEYIKLMNRAAVANNYADASLWWQSRYEDRNFTENIDKLWKQVEPLYTDLHTYAKYKLLEIYGDKINRSDPNIPAHLLGNMWAQSWNDLYDDIKPFKDASLVDATAQLQEKKYNAKKMFEASNEFYTSLGLPSNEASYTGDSVIEKPKDRIIQCHASAWDFCDGTDFRIKMCTNINMHDFVVIHHEMGHIQYYIQYKDLPMALRGGANPAFHEAVGDTMAISVSTPQHLIKLGLLQNYKDSFEDNVNALLSEALERVAFLPFGLLIDKWRWDVFSGKVPESQWNTHWWKLRETYQKVSAPVPRSENDFDAGSKFHVPANSQYIAYFVAHILEFQFYEALCIEAGQYDPNNHAGKPLHKCDFYQSKAAGQKLADGLKLGVSKHWSEALRAITGSTEVSASSLLTYFKPLQEFLKTQNQRLEKEDELRQVLSNYESEASQQCNRLVKAEWDVATDLNNNANNEVLTKTVAESAEFDKQQYTKHFSGLNHTDYIDEKIQRQVLYLSKLGTSALDEKTLNEFSEIKANMTKYYNNAVFCDYFKQDCDLEKEAITLEPEIENIMSSSENFEQLKYTWEQWHNKSGAPMRNDYRKYISIANEAAKKNNYADYGEMWRSSYEDPKLQENLIAIWKQVEPLYKEIHTYTRRQLSKLYPNKIDAKDELIPAHLLGNMWAQSWVNLYERIKPFKNSSDIDITTSLKEKYTFLKMYQESDRFYKSLGLESNEMSYTGDSVIEKPTDRVIVCHASAWDFCDGRDFRIKQCTTLTHRNFVTIHHEMGHIQYYILYKDQPITFRRGANPGFHEAVGDLIALSVSTPNHLQKIGILKDYKDTHEDNINALLKMALQRVAFLPFGLLIDLYRYDLFSGKVPENKWNAHWEELRENYQKIRSPVPRTEAHFDAGAKYHVPGDTQYIAYFISHILQFQLHRSLCKEAGQYDPNDVNKPLHKCDIEGSLAAGNKIRAGLSLGLSKHWKKTLKVMTGDEDISAEAILEYFKPLHDYLKKVNAEAEEDNDAVPLVPIVVGVVIGSVLVAGLGVFLYKHYQKPKQ